MDDPDTSQQAKDPQVPLDELPGPPQQATDPQASPDEQAGDGQEPLDADPTYVPIIAVKGRFSTYLVTELGKDVVCLGGFYQDSICTIKLHLVYHAYESHFRVTAIIPRIVSTAEENQHPQHHVVFQLPAQAFGYDMDKVTIDTVKSTESLPQVMREDSNSVGLNHPIEPENEEVRLVLETLRRIPGQTNKIKLYARMNGRQINEFDEMLLHLSHVNSDNLPLQDYYAKSGKPVIQWNAMKAPEDCPGYDVPADTSFRKTDYWMITHGYGITREAKTQQAKVKELSEVAVEMSVIEAPGGTYDDGQHKFYVAFLNVPDIALARQVLDINEMCEVLFEPPWEYEHDDVKPSGWRAQVISPLPEVNVNCNLTLLLTRKKGNSEPLSVSPVPGPNMPTDIVFLLAKSDENTPKRLINGIETVGQAQTPSARNLQRLILGTDLSERKPHGLFDNMTSEQVIKLHKLKDRLTKSQQVALEYVMNHKDIIALVTGPPGTGKTYFAVILIFVCRIVDLSSLVIAPSSTAVDNVATCVQEHSPEERAMRYHSSNFEERAMRRQARQSKAKAATSTDVPEDEGFDSDAEDNNDGVPVSKDTLSEEEIALQQLLFRLRKNAASGKKGKGRNFKTMSAFQRCMERAGLIEDDDSNLPQGGRADLHSEFRDLFFALGALCQEMDKNVAEELEETKKKFEGAYKSLREDTFISTNVLVTTCSNAADPELRRSYRPDVIIGDELAQGQEVETLLATIFNIESVKLFVLIGDAKQLRPIVMTKGVKLEDGSMANPFANQIQMSFFARLRELAYPSVMFLEQHRMAKGLSEPSSSLWYGGRIIDAPGTELSNRPNARKCIEFVNRVWDLKTKVPRVVLNVSIGVCITDLGGSRRNLHNIAVTLTLMEDLVRAGVFALTDIVIQTPYRAQALGYFSALYTASKMAFWKDQDISQVPVITVDSFQGGEGGDTVTAKARKGGIGFTTDEHRLNVAITRPRDGFFIICDMNALDDDTNAKDVKTDDDNECIEDELPSGSTTYAGKLRQTLNFYLTEGCVVPAKLDDKQSYVDLSPAAEIAKEYEAEKIKRNPCFNCQEQGHQASVCKKPRKDTQTCRNCGEVGHTGSDCPKPRIDNRVCNNCHKVGHVLRDCPEPRHENRGCLSCGERGHIKRDCPAPKKDNRQCKRCGKRGHIIRDCPGLKAKAAAMEGQAAAGEGQAAANEGQAAAG